MKPSFCKKFLRLFAFSQSCTPSVTESPESSQAPPDVTRQKGILEALLLTCSRLPSAPVLAETSLAKVMRGFSNNECGS